MDTPGTLTATERSLEWVRDALEAQLQNYWKPPDEGIYHLYRDETFSLLDDPEAFRNYATVFRGMLDSTYSQDGYDCENYAFDLQSAFTRTRPFTNGVGVLMDFDMDHAFNVVLFSDGTVVRWEPQTADDVTDELRYRPSTGVLVL
ncbi:MAG: hypothetical protein ABEH47_03775 [Haloferacaceae archaeon]